MRLTAVAALILLLSACGRADQELDDGPEDENYPTSSVTPSTVTETADPNTSDSSE